MKVLGAIVALIFLTCAHKAAAQAARIIDGDTLEVAGETFRLHGIDAPEYGQECTKTSGGTWPCGKESTAFLKSITHNQTVHCDDRGSDGYKRTIAVCKVGGSEINAKMVAAGLAWAFERYSDDYLKEQKAAQAAKVGVWQTDTQTPWDFRKARWEVAEQEAPRGCPIKGNISKSGEKIYHPPWSPWYSRTKISEDKGERWFCSEDEAIAAGWRAPIWGG